MKRNDLLKHLRPQGCTLNLKIEALSVNKFRCSEYVHDVANARYGKETKEARQWCEATLTRIYYDCHEDVLDGLRRIKAQNQEVQDKIDTFYNYLRNHGEKMNYSSARRGGYHIGSGAIESANKFISHTRLKRCMERATNLGSL